MTKGDLINGAYSRLRVSGLTTQPTPEDITLALNRLEMMAQEWRGRNICTGYKFEDSPDVNTPSNVDPQYWNAYESNLAVRLAGDFNIQPHAALVADQRQAFSYLSASTAKQKQTNYPSRMPRGSGNTLRYNRWQRFYRPQEEAPLSCLTNVLNVGDIQDYTEHFDFYLQNGETVISAQLQVDNGLDLVSSSSTDIDVLYRIKAVGNNEISNNLSLEVKIQVTTSLGRVTSKTIHFKVLQFDIENTVETPSGFEEFLVSDGAGAFEEFITADGETFFVTE